MQRRPGARPRAAPWRAAARPRRGSSSAASGSSPEANESDTRQKPNSAVDQSTISAPSCDRCAGAGGRGAQVVEHEVAVRDGVERVLGDAAEAELLGHEHPAGVEVHAGQRAGAERQVVGGRHAEVEALQVAAELPEVGEQVVRQVDRLRALQVRVARAAASRGGARPARPASPSARAAATRASSAWARTSIATSVATWSLRERAVCSLPPTGPASSVSRRSIAMWTSSSSSLTTKRSCSISSRTCGQPALDLLQVVLGDDAAAGEHARVRERLLEVVGREPVVEADRRVERLEERVLGVAEAAHRVRQSLRP